MRQALASLLRRLFEALVRLYYPTRTVEGAARIPAGVPVIFVLNHPNGLLDPLVLRVAVGWPARFLGKSTLFGSALGRLAMEAFGTIPVYRTQESGARAGDVGRNEESFARCRAALARGEALALFPEGASHSDPQLRPLKTGAARIALSAEYEYGATSPLRITIVPVGLHYERKTLFRSGVLLVVGEPIVVAPLLPAYRADERATVESLTAEIKQRLDAVVLQAETRDLMAGIARVANWTADIDRADPDTDPQGLGASHRRALELVAAYQRVRDRDPARVEAIAASARAYARTLRQLGVPDPWALEIEVVRPRHILAAVARLILSLPLAVAGAVLGWIPYRLAGQVAGRLTRDDDILGTAKLVTGTVFLLVGWIIAAVVVGVWAGPLWGAAAFALGVAGGYAALRFDEMRAEVAEAVRTLWIRAWHFDTARRLADRRRALAEDVARALREV
ncbi:MAG TPA: lysophospholipid acyltransferase family protein [Polyangia bacterium]|jgi:1-acyl-sn-glycerol-3-phosphate acyltransferase|nr:lysophospholipid acyltransferase family protein [Polyangia bacterium]